MPSRSESASSSRSNVIELTSEFYIIESILQEREGKEGTEYLVRWAGKDKSTGKAWPLDWIPCSWANSQTRRLWAEEKTERAVASSPAPQARPDRPAAPVFVQVPPLDSNFPEDEYTVISAAASQLTQSSEAPSRDTDSWREGVCTQNLIFANSQRLLLPTQSSLASYSVFEIGSQQEEVLLVSSLEASTPSEELAIAPSLNCDDLDVPSSVQSATCTLRESISGETISVPITSAQPHAAVFSIPSPELNTLVLTQINPQESSTIENSSRVTSNLTSPEESNSPRQAAIVNGDSDEPLVSLSQRSLGSQAGAHTQSSLGSVVDQCDLESPGATLHSASKFRSPGISFQNSATIRSYQLATESSLERCHPPNESPTMSSSLNGNSMISPPMQDRVRSIRNSALSTQNRRGNNEDSSPMSSRSTSLAPETSKQRGASESRPDSQAPEPFIRSQMDVVFPDIQDDSEESTASQIELTLPTNGDNSEYFVALPLPSRVKSQYDETIKYFRKSMRAFLSNSTDAETVQAIQRLVQRLNNISTHVDLENEEWEKTQSEPVEDLTKWAQSSSSKFVFLTSLCNMLRDQSVHIAIVAKQPRLLYILERFMQGIQVDYVRPDSGKRTIPANSQSRLKVSLILAGPEGQVGPWTSTNLVIAFDGAFDPSEKHIKTLRSNPAIPGGLAPVVHPMVYCSAEHLNRCIQELDGLKTEIDRLRALATAIDERDTEFGDVAAEDLRPEAAGEEVSHFVLNGGQRSSWTVVPIQPIKIPGLEVLLQDEFSPAPATVPMVSHLISSPNSRKRPSEEELEDEPEPQKRQRTSDIAETTHISESTFASSAAQIADLRQALETAESARRAATAKVERLQNVVAEREQSLTDQRKALDDLLTRYEATKRAKAKLLKEKNAVDSLLEKANRRHESNTATIEQLREATQNTAAELEAARGELKNSSIPEVSQMEQLREESRRLSSEREASDKKLRTMEHDFEFTRQQYQQASSKAAEHASQIQELEQEITSLRQKASGEAVRLRELTNRSEIETHIADNARLRAENEELKEQLKRKERGRGMTTRTGSVAPRSPRLGASPGRSRAGSRAPGSRPQSPVRNIYGPRRGRGLVEQSL